MLNIISRINWCFVHLFFCLKYPQMFYSFFIRLFNLLVLSFKRFFQCILYISSIMVREHTLYDLYDLNPFKYSKGFVWYCCWMQYSTNVNEVRLVDIVFLRGPHYWFSFFLFYQLMKKECWDHQLLLWIFFLFHLFSLSGFLHVFYNCH